MASSERESYGPRNLKGRGARERNKAGGSNNDSIYSTDSPLYSILHVTLYIRPIRIGPWPCLSPSPSHSIFPFPPLTLSSLFSLFTMKSHINTSLLALPVHHILQYRISHKGVHHWEHHLRVIAAELAQQSRGRLTISSHSAAVESKYHAILEILGEEEKRIAEMRW